MGELFFAHTRLFVAPKNSANIVLSTSTDKIKVGPISVIYKSQELMWWDSSYWLSFPTFKQLFGWFMRGGLPLGSLLVLSFQCPASLWKPWASCFDSSTDWWERPSSWSHHEGWRPNLVISITHFCHFCWTRGKFARRGKLRTLTPVRSTDTVRCCYVC